LMLRGDSVRIRALEYEDIEHLWRWQNNRKVMEHMWIEPQSRRSLEKEFEEKLDDKAFGRFIIEVEGQPIGLIWYYSMVPNDRCGIGIYIGETDMQGKGYGTDAIRTFLDYLFNIKGVHRVGLDLSVQNEQALRAYEKVGFKREGLTREYYWKDGERVDLINMGMLRREFL